MLRYLILGIIGIPYVIYSTIRMKIYNNSKKNISDEIIYQRLRKTVLFINKLLRIKINIENKEILENNKKAVIVSNHLSVVDILVIIAMSPHPLIFISKKENNKVPILAAHLRAIGCLCIDRHDLKQSLHISKEAGMLVNDKNKSVVIFAEGTRNKEGKVAKFKAAFPTIVHYAHSDTILICVHNTNKVLKYHPLLMKTNVHMHIFTPITYEYYLENKKEFADITHKLVSDKLEEYNNEYNRNNRKES